MWGWYHWGTRRWGLTGLLILAARPKITWVNIYDSSGTLQARIQQWQSLSYTIRSNKPGTLELKLHKNAVGADALINGRLIEVRRAGSDVWAGIICHIERMRGEEGAASDWLIVQAKSAEWLPYWRMVVPPDGSDYMTRTDNVDDAVKYFVRQALESGYASASRALSGFTVEADNAEHPDTKTLAARYQDNLGELLEKWADAYGFDWWVDADPAAGTYTFRTAYPRRGSDKSTSVIFTSNRHNLLELDYWQDEVDKSSLVYVGGPGDGASQTIRTVYEGSEPTGWDRREAFVAAADAEYTDELDAAGKAWLATFGQELTGVRITLQPDAYQWPDDFDIGDLVTIYDADWSINKQAKIEEISVSIDENGIEDITVTVGEPKPTQWDLLKAGLGPYSSFDDNAAPATPTGLSYSTGTYQDDQGTWYAKLELDWDDNSELDLAGYVAEIKRSGETKWQAQRVTASEAIFESLELGGSYYARVKAVDRASNESAYADFNSGSAIAMPADTYAPATPTGLTVTAGKKSIRITVDRNTEKDWDGNEFHVSTTSGFTPSSATLVHSGKTTSFTYTTSSYDTHYVKVRAYDTSGNYSAFTSEASATPEKISPDPDIPPDSIPNDRIISLKWAKIEDVVITDADIQNVSVNKLTAGGLNCSVTIQSGGKFEVSGKFRIDNSAIHILGTQGLKFYYGSSYIYLFYNSNQRLEAGGAFECGQLHVDGYAYLNSKVYVGGSELIMQGNAIRLGSSGGYPYLYNSSGNTCRCGGFWAFLGDVAVDGDFTCNGTKNAVIAISKGRCLLSAIESPEVLFADRALGEERAGRIIVQPDPLFMETLDEAGGLWLIPAYVARREEGGVVADKREKLWWIVGTRQGYVGWRLEEAKDAEDDNDS